MRETLRRQNASVGTCMCAQCLSNSCMFTEENLECVLQKGA